MTRYLIDENLPYYFSLWNNKMFIHVNDLPSVKTDNEIWEYAKENNLIIVTKDSDFSNRHNVQIASSKSDTYPIW
jgi:predicted nuclease of predicted toxin-antitoxin system